MLSLCHHYASTMSPLCHYMSQLYHHMSPLCHYMSPLCHHYVTTCHQCVIIMSPLCHYMSPLCHHHVTIMSPSSVQSLLTPGSWSASDGQLHPEHPDWGAGDRDGGWTPAHSGHWTGRHHHWTGQLVTLFY